MKWNGTDFALSGGSESQRAKSRPEKINYYSYVVSCARFPLPTNSRIRSTEPKSRANVTFKQSSSNTYDLGRSHGRVARSAEAHFDAHDERLSNSLLDLLPKNARTDSSGIDIAHAETLYSFDNAGPSPNEFGRKVGLEGLVEKAEKKWVSEQTEKIVRGEYEVLDEEGETTTFKKGKKSPKQKAIKTQPAVLKEAEDDDGFELI
jgi:hypothetical protein